MTPAEQQRRRYDSPIRRQRVAETRERIVAAGVELLHGFPIWNWRALTHRAVAEYAGVAERTVYRYFGSERELRDAVMSRMEQEAGIELEGLDLDEVQDVAVRIFEHVSKFPIEPRTPRDPTVAEANERQRKALLEAVRRAAKGWRANDRVIAAAMLDVLWAPVAFERLVTDWDLDPKEATTAITWTIRLIERALDEGPRPR
ncbi:MAG TPA: helix-turn-helix domain-containing protein [Acidimicrobiales bacterium]|nr:helix-turn-helix domain-containing protein [Acidimicrobiales bacterium]